MTKQPKTSTPDAPDFSPHATQLTEAIAFISATLGETYVSADATTLHWGAHACLLGGARGYPVVLTAKPALKIEVSFMQAKDRAHVRLYAIIGWAHYHGVDVEHD